eukprot:3519855-Amphidinium_carterae.1
MSSYLFLLYTLHTCPRVSRTTVLIAQMTACWRMHPSKPVLAYPRPPPQVAQFLRVSLTGL